jgi:hypothetical protein
MAKFIIGLIFSLLMLGFGGCMIHLNNDVAGGVCVIAGIFCGITVLAGGLDGDS